MTVHEIHKVPRRGSPRYPQDASKKAVRFPFKDSFQERTNRVSVCCHPEGCAAPSKVQCWCNTWRPLSKLKTAIWRHVKSRVDGRDHVDIRVGDAAAIDLPDASVDAVFDFAIVHHVPDWRAAIGEIRRVLRPGGRFYYSEVTKHALDRPSYRLLFDHPVHDRFTASDFVAALEERDLTVGDRQRAFIRGDYTLGVAERVPETP